MKETEKNEYNDYYYNESYKYYNPEAHDIEYDYNCNDSDLTYRNKEDNYEYEK
jgi:hypothetical protein